MGWTGPRLFQSTTPSYHHLTCLAASCKTPRMRVVSVGPRNSLCPGSTDWNQWVVTINVTAARGSGNSGGQHANQEFKREHWGRRRLQGPLQNSNILLGTSNSMQCRGVCVPWRNLWGLSYQPRLTSRPPALSQAAYVSLLGFEPRLLGPSTKADKLTGSRHWRKSVWSPARPLS